VVHTVISAVGDWARRIKGSSVRSGILCPKPEREREREGRNAEREGGREGQKEGAREGR
jgi:hypothetical protein